MSRVAALSLSLMAALSIGFGWGYFVAEDRAYAVYGEPPYKCVSEEDCAHCPPPNDDMDCEPK